MLTFQQKRFLRQVVTSRVMHVLLLLVVIGLGTAVYGRYEIAQDMAERRERAEANLTELEARKAALEERVEYITSERGIEAEMRRQFDVAREGEQVVIILDEPAE